MKSFVPIIKNSVVIIIALFFINISFLNAQKVTGSLLFADSLENEVLSYNSGSKFYIILDDADQNSNGSVIETCELIVNSLTEINAETLSLTETGVNTGIFMGSMIFQESTANNGDGILQVNKGDKLIAVYYDSVNDFGNPDTITTKAYYDISLLSGTIDTDSTLTKVKSPYLVTGDLNVDSGSTLIVEPGVEIYFMPLSDDQLGGSDKNRCELIVYGSIIANGTEADSIRFTSESDNPSPGDWYGIKIDGYYLGGFVEFSYSKIEYTVHPIDMYDTFGSINDTIKITNNVIAHSTNSFYFQKCYEYFIIDNNSFDHVNSSTVWFHCKIVEFTNNTISSSGKVYFSELDSVYFFNNNLTNEDCYGGYGGVSISLANRAHVLNNYFTNCKVSLSSVDDVVVTGNTINGSTSSMSRGLEMKGVKALVKYNKIIGDAYTGVFVERFFGHLLYNTIFNGIVSINSPDITVNYNNLYESREEYAFYNSDNATNEIDAKYNFWGDYTTDIINAGGNPKNINGIYDQFDNADCGFVNYSYWLNSKWLNNETDITACSFAEQTGTAKIDSLAHTVSVELAYGTDVTNLTPAITVSYGAQVTPTGTYDFTTPVTYTVTAEDEITTQDWAVSVSVALNFEFDITSYSFAEQISEAIIDTEEHTVSVEVAYDTDVTVLVATYKLSAGASGAIVDTAQESGVTANDFTSPVTYTVTAENGTTTQDWVVTVTKAVSVEDITNKGINIYPNPSNGVINITLNKYFKLEIIDITGKIIFTKDINDNNTVKIYKKGVYFLRFSKKNTTIIRKVVVK